MNIAGIDYESVKDGEGVRTVIYVSGCSHDCYGCHNPQTHNIHYGKPFTKELQNEILGNIKKRPFISGLTWSGGDPLHQNNVKDVLDFTNIFKSLFPEKTIWLYTGYKFEEIIECKYDASYINNYKVDALRQVVVSKCDVIVDGQYIDSQRDITLKWKGSKNQRVIDVQKSLRENKVVLYT
ncbi:MAG: anaerobic ribonucleoside-triphosphate reductase activating protein [bacterium]|nr:anaerobic ribonucleoside-triphosphate reductase activating protein [bacterium]